MNEYDYNGLYNNRQPNANPGANPNPANANVNPAAPNQAAPGAAAQVPNPAAQAPNPAPQAGGYPNVGSSGLNTANQQPNYGGYNAAQGPAQGYHAPQQENGYTSTFGGGNNTAGGYNGYSYASTPPQQPKKQHGGAKKVALRVVAGIGVVALGFGGGYAGALAANHGNTGGQVVVQQVERAATADVQGSTGGSNLTLAEISAMVQPSVVAITTEQMVSSNTWFGGSYIESGAGSGVVISDDGYILTCNHVVSGATSIKVQMSDDTEYDATMVAGDATSDIAVLKVEATGLTPAVIGDSDALAVGEEAIAVGNPLGTLGGTVTNGIVSALNREVTVQQNKMNLIQTNASISPGNSGGGLFNAAGELVGIVNARSADTSAEGLGFAIPVNTAMDIAKELMETGSIARPVLGITVYTVSDANTAAQLGVNALGAYITTVNPGSGADAAGVKAGDRIVAIGDVAVTTSTDVTNYLSDKAAGDVVTLQVEREGKILSLDVTLGVNNNKQ